MLTRTHQTEEALISCYRKAFEHAGISQRDREELMSKYNEECSIPSFLQPVWIEELRQQERLAEKKIGVL